jgi:transcriptional regulator with XRE-family HTH domain
MRESRRSVSSSLSSRVVTYVVANGLTQAEMAKVLGVSEGFVSLVKSKERSLTIDHLELLSHAVNLPLGAFLNAVNTPGPNSSARSRELFEITSEFVTKLDELRSAILRDSAATPRV